MKTIVVQCPRCGVIDSVAASCLLPTGLAVELSRHESVNTPAKAEGEQQP